MKLDIKALFTRKNGLLLVFLAAALLPPLFISRNYIMSVLVTCLMFAAMGFAWNIIGGYGGHVAWCHSAFIAVGAYTCFILYNQAGVSPFLSMPLGMLICYVFATIMGKVTLQYRGPFFAISTIVFVELLRVALLYFSGLTNGSSGIVIAYTEENFWDLLFKNDTPYYYISLVLLLLCILVTRLFLNSKTGHYLQTIKGDQDAAQSLGIDIGKVKLHAFQLSAVMTSVVGAVYALFITYIEPATIASTDLAIRIGAVVIIGGMGKFWGPLLGAFVVIPLSELALQVFPEGGAQLFYGLLLIVIMLLIPGGILSLFDKDERAKSWFAQAKYGIRRRRALAAQRKEEGQ